MNTNDALFMFAILAPKASLFLFMISMIWSRMAIVVHTKPSSPPYLREIGAKWPEKSAVPKWEGSKASRG